MYDCIKNIKTVLTYGCTGEACEKLVKKINSLDENDQLEIINEIPAGIRFMKDRTSEFYIKAVKTNINSFRYIANDCDEKVRIQAIKLEPASIEYITNPSLLLVELSNSVNTLNK